MPIVEICDRFASELWCNSVTNQCEKIAFANKGELCGKLSDGSFAYCGDGLVCQFTDSTNPGTCVDRVPVGQSCDPNFRPNPNGSRCAWPALCFDGTCGYVPQGCN